MLSNCMHHARTGRVDEAMFRRPPCVMKSLPRVVSIRQYLYMRASGAPASVAAPSGRALRLLLGTPTLFPVSPLRAFVFLAT